VVRAAMDPMGGEERRQTVSHGLHQSGKPDHRVTRVELAQKHRQYGGTVEESKSCEERTCFHQQNCKVPAKITGDEGRRPFILHVWISFR